MIGFDIYTYKQLRRLDRIRLNVNGQGDVKTLYAVLRRPVHVVYILAQISLKLVKRLLQFQDGHNFRSVVDPFPVN